MFILLDSNSSIVSLYLCIYSAKYGGKSAGTRKEMSFGSGLSDTCYVLSLFLPRRAYVYAFTTNTEVIARVLDFLPGNLSALSVYFLLFF